MKKSTMALLWLGASISISEIFTGGLLAPLGAAKGMAAIIIGHAAGTALLAFGGFISFSRKANAMECAAFSLGRGGGKIVALCNVLQLTGWTVIMVVQAVSAVSALFPVPFAPAAAILAALVVLWALILGSPAARLNDAVVALLAALCAVLFADALRQGGSSAAPPGGGMTLALGIELSIAMPVSWLPLAGDYAVRARGKTCAAAMPFAGYFTGSVAMYAFGLFIALTSGADIFAFIASSRFRVPACAVVILSTLTTAFLDLYSAAVSSQQLIPARGSRPAVLAFGAAAVALSAFFPIERYESFLTAFLTAIGMVFIPVYAVIFLDFACRRGRCAPAVNAPGLIIAACGMAAYRIFTRYDLWIPTLGTLALTAALYGAWYGVIRRVIPTNVT